MIVTRQLIAGFFWINAVVILLTAGGLWESLIFAGIGYAFWPQVKRASLLDW